MAEPTRTMPMFPLGSVLLPSVVLPLHVFEPRYRQLVDDCLAGDREFGVVLIERGSEVGGGDVRTDVGTVAQMVGATELGDGRWYVVAVGTRRLRVERWLDDAPYPRAEVTDWIDDPAAPPADPDDYAALTASVRRLLALAAEVGAPSAAVTTEFADDPGLGTFQMAAALPLGSLDRQRVLATEGSGARRALLDELVSERAADLRAELALADEPEPGSE